MQQTPNYTLMNGVDQNKKHPDTFWIPSHDARIRAMRLYKTVKLVFDPTKADHMSERMWVNIIDYDGENVVGALASIPVVFPHNVLDYDDEVLFTIDNIIDISDEDHEIYDENGNEIPYEIRKPIATKD